MISFDNTEIAFKAKSDADLTRAYRLFKLVGNPGLVKFGKWATDLALRLRLPIRGAVKKTIFKQFCGGETIAECDATIAQLGKFGIGTILDYSVEGKTSQEDFEATANEIIATILRGSADMHIPFSVFKVTGIARFGILEKCNNPETELTEAERLEFQHVWNRVERICLAAYEAGVPVFIDAEETWIQDTIDRLAISMMAKFNRGRVVVYNTVQMYRHDRLAHIHAALKQGQQGGYHYGVKLVRGAYMEKERERAKQLGYSSPIQPDKESSDRDYNEALSLLLKHIDRCAVVAGSHNEQSALVLTQLMEKLGIEKQDKRIYFAQLLGMSDHISYNLAHHGYNVAKYVPYGPVREVMPYLIRRAEENTSVAGQTGRELTLIMKERKRRAEKK
jgi:proline dehydrogenase